MVIIEGKTENSSSSRSFFKKFSIPEGVRPEAIRSTFSPSGVLTISAPIEIESGGKESVTNMQVTESTTSRKEQQSFSNFRSDSQASENSEFVLQPKLNVKSLLALANDSQFEDVSKQICQINDGKNFEVSSSKIKCYDFTIAL
jgi:hypothetical protein